MPPYPVNMDHHGPARSLEDYLAELYARLDAMALPSPEGAALARRIITIENELVERSAT